MSSMSIARSSVAKCYGEQVSLESGNHILCLET